MSKQSFKVRHDIALRGKVVKAGAVMEFDSESEADMKLMGELHASNRLEAFTPPVPVAPVAPVTPEAPEAPEETNPVK